MDLDSINRWFAPWKRRIMSAVRRCTISGTTEGLGLERLQIQTLADVTQEGVERLQNYGFAGRPKKGSEGLVIYLGGNQDHGVVIAVDDARYRLKTLEEGEVAIYTDEGDKIHLKRGKVIDIVTGTLNIIAETEVNITSPKITATADGAIEMTAGAPMKLTAPTMILEAATGVTVTTPAMAVSGTIAASGIGAGVPPEAGKAKISGEIEANSVKDANGTMQEMRTTYNGHTHPENGTGGGTTSAPNEPMS